jgi:hypothetical protein
MSSFTVYFLYHLIFSESSIDPMNNALVFIIDKFFISLLFLLSLTTGNIDFKSKKAFHSIHGYTMYAFGSKVLFQVLMS